LRLEILMTAGRVKTEGKPIKRLFFDVAHDDPRLIEKCGSTKGILHSRHNEVLQIFR